MRHEKETFWGEEDGRHEMVKSLSEICQLCFERVERATLQWEQKTYVKNETTKKCNQT